MNRIFNLLFSVRLSFHILVYYTSSYRTTILDYERDAWLNANGCTRRGLAGFLFLLNMFPEYRSLFYHRTNAHWLSCFAKGQTNLYFHTPSRRIGKGFVLWHGYATDINAKSIGQDCQVWQRVTIGKKNSIPGVDDRPVLGNNVRVCVGALIFGSIKVGDNVVVGAGCVVPHDIPPNCTAIGNPAKIVTKHK